MNFGFSDEQGLLRQQVRKFLDEQCPLETVRRIQESAEGYSREQWKQLGELGFLGLILPEEFGGAGLGWVDLVVLLEETGRSLFPSPLLSTTLAGALILAAGDAAQHRRLLPGIADGSRIGTVAVLEASDQLAPEGIALRGERRADAVVLSGEKCFVTDAGQADLFVVAFRTGPGPRDLALGLVEAGAKGVSVAEIATLDRTRRSGRVRFDGVSVAADALLGAPGAAWPAIEAHLDRGAAAVTAEAIGTLEGALALTVQYAKDRVQFGSPIGRYQGVKHPLAEIYVDLECLKSLLYYAAWALDDSPEEVPVAVSEAKAFGSLALMRAGIEAIQLHGAVGYTAEYDVQLYLKRSKWARPLFGDEDHHHDRIARLGGY
jgi:alkylation response protein AidB-like acyl-CoA dehydrogenase